MSTRPRLITRPSAEQILAASGDHETLNEDLDQIGLKIIELRIPPNSASIGSHLSKLSFDAQNQFVAIAIRHATAEITKNPGGHYVIRPDDTILMLAHHSAVPQSRQSVEGYEMVYRDACV